MPYERSSAKVEELSWEHFSAPPPELATWKPDADAVPVAGSRPDPRFNTNLFSEQLKQVQKRQKLSFGRAVDSCDKEPPTRSTPNPIGVNRWTKPVPHITLPSSASSAASNFAPCASPAPTEVSLVPFKESQSSASEISSSSEWAGRAQVTMDSLSVQHPSHRPPIPPGCVSSPVDKSHHNTVAPWARSLEHLLQDPSPRSSLPSRAAPAQRQSAVLPMSSIPPHLRRAKQGGGSTSTGAFQRSEHYCLNRTGQDRFVEQEQAVEPGVKPTQPPKDIHLQKNPVSSSPTHQRYLQTKLVSIMEDEMDMQSRMTRRKLQAMPVNEFESYFDQTVSMHKLAWNLKQLRDEIEKNT